MISDEGQIKAAVMMRDAAEANQRAAEIMQAAAHRMSLLLDNGYGGNGLLLLEALQKLELREEK